MKRLSTLIRQNVRIITAAISLVIMCVPSAPHIHGAQPSAYAPVAAPAGWEAVTASSAPAEQDISQPMTVTSRGGYIYVTLREPATIKVFTILGQQLSQQSLATGQWRLRMKARGIYIIKSGAVTCRVTV